MNFLLIGLGITRRELISGGYTTPAPDSAQLRVV